jgi:hypothetical protein
MGRMALRRLYRLSLDFGGADVEENVVAELLTFTLIQVSLIWRDNTTSVYATPSLEIHHWRSRATSAKMQL